MPWRNVPNTCEQTTAIRNLYHNVAVTYLTTYGQWHIYYYKQLAMDIFELTMSFKEIFVKTVCNLSSIFLLITLEYFNKKLFNGPYKYGYLLKTCILFYLKEVLKGFCFISFL